MPELPEVEEVRRTLEPHLLGIPVAEVRVLRADFITPGNPPLHALVRRAFARTKRHGKKLFLTIGDVPGKDATLLVHLGMSGRIDCVPSNAPVEKHTHLILSLENGTDIRFRDPRRFGGVWFYPTLAEALAKEVAALGPDALELTPGHLAHWKNARGGKLKHRLLSQQDVAGLGNIYVDEALFLAKLHPMQRVNRLMPGQIAELVAAIKRVLHKSLRSGGTTLRDYRNVSNQPGDFARKLQAYGRGGQPCVRCRTTMESVQIATRTTTFCPSCQKRR